MIDCGGFTGLPELTACALPAQVWSRWRRAWMPAALLLIIGALAFGGVRFYARTTWKGTDYNVFYLGGHLAVERPDRLYMETTARGETYTYISPPVLAVLMWPLSSLPIGPSALAWFMVNVVCTAHASLILSRLLAPEGMAGPFLVVVLLLGLPYTVENIQLGQLHAVILYFMVLSFAALRGGRPAVGAAWMAAAAAIKLLPGVFGVYFLARRQWRILTAFILAFALFTAALPAIALGPRTAAALLAQFYRLQVAPYISGESALHPIYARTALRKTPHDQDLGALLMRHFTAAHALPGYEHLVLARLELGTVRGAMFIGFVAMLSISAIVAWPGTSNKRADTGSAFAVFVTLSLLLSPRNRVAYWPVLMIPWAVLLARVMDARASPRLRRIAAWTLSVSALLCAFVAVPAGRAMTIGFWGQVALWAGLLALCRAERRASAPIPLSPGLPRP